MTHVKHEPHCRFCTEVAVARQQDGSWVCADHERYVPWGAAVLAHLPRKIVDKEQQTVQEDR